MKKRAYRETNIKDVNEEKLAREVAGKRVVIGLDISKEWHNAAVMTEEREVVACLKWEHPSRSREAADLFSRLPWASVEAAMEPSGVYGDVFRRLLRDRGIAVHLVSAKRSHDAMEVFDGSPSKHDQKDAVIVGRLHLEGASGPWREKSERERDVAAAVGTMDMYLCQFQQAQNRLEGMLARHWPELPGILEIGTATFSELLKEYGGPAGVAEDTAGACRLMRRSGGNFLSTEKIGLVIASAGATVGVPMSAGEERALSNLAQEALRARKEKDRSKKDVEKLGRADDTILGMGAVVGMTTAAVVVSEVGDPKDYPSAAAYRKGVGLNLVERSSGKHKGRLRISKRGSGIARKWLYMASLRLLQRSDVVRAWYERKLGREGGKNKMLAVTAVMRKLILALWWVGRGASFNEGLLYDVGRLGLSRRELSA